MAVLTEDQRRKWDESNDDLFYAEPRFVQHLDEAFRRRLTQLYRQRIPPASGAGFDEQLGQPSARGDQLPKGHRPWIKQR